MSSSSRRTDDEAALLIPGLRRQGGHSAVNLDELTHLTVSHQVDMLGDGPYQVILLAGCGFAAFAESIEMGAVAPLHTALGNYFKMTEDDRAAMAFAAYGGSALGVILSGFLCDTVGRKTTLILSSLMITVVTLLTAVVPPYISLRLIVTLRFLAGVACSVGGPASMVLLVECSPTVTRASTMFAIIFICNIGYVVLAVGLEATMPLLGEGPDDDWRALCFFLAAPAMASVPLLLVLVESPSYLVAKKRDVEGCLKALDYIGYVNGKRAAEIRVTNVPLPMMHSKWRLLEFMTSLGKFQGQELLAVAVLTVMDTSRMFFTAGSAYLWKDLFFSAGSSPETVSPATINVVASMAPLAGLIIGERLLWMGIQRLLLLCTFIGATSLMFLTVPSIRAALGSLILFVMLAKLVYGPMTTCVALLKAETFATEIRAVAFSVITVVAKSTSIISPVLIETMKDESQDGTIWADEPLRQYLLILVVAVCFAGASSFFLPKGIEDGCHLEDYVKTTPTSSTECWALSRGYGSGGDGDSLSYWDIWDGTVRHSEKSAAGMSSDGSSPRYVEEIAGDAYSSSR